MPTTITRAIKNLLGSHNLSNCQRIGVIKLIPKADKDPRVIGNLRPITLLSALYKIVSGCIASKLKPRLDSIIKPWQKTYLPGRYILELTRNVYDIFQHALSLKKPGYLLLVNFSKAFGSISFDLIPATLKQF